VRPLIEYEAGRVGMRGRVTAEVIVHVKQDVGRTFLSQPIRRAKRRHARTEDSDQSHPPPLQYARCAVATMRS
jgi:hypothetical protein